MNILKIIETKFIIKFHDIISVGASQPESTVKTVRIGPMTQSDNIYQFEDGQIRLLWEWQKKKK